MPVPDAAQVGGEARTVEASSNNSVSLTRYEPRTDLSQFFFYPQQALARRDEAGSAFSSSSPPPVDAASTAGQRPRRTKVPLKWFLLGVGVLIVLLAVAIAWLTRSSPVFQSSVHFDGVGQSVLELRCASCTKATSVSVAGVSAPLDGGAAVLVLPTLRVGSNSLTAALYGADGASLSESNVEVELPLRLLPDLTFDRGTPVLRWSVETAPGVAVRIDNQEVRIGPERTGSYELDVSNDCSGASADKASVKRTVHFVALRGDSVVAEGDQTVSAMVLPLEASFSATDQEKVRLTGQTLDGTTVLLNNAPLALEGGSFSASVLPATPIELVARRTGFLPRTVRLSSPSVAERAKSTSQPSRDPRVIDRRVRPLAVSPRPEASRSDVNDDAERGPLTDPHEVEGPPQLKVEGDAVDRGGLAGGRQSNGAASGGAR